MDKMDQAETLVTSRAAPELGVNDATVKQWIFAGKLTTIRPPAATIASLEARSHH